MLSKKIIASITLIFFMALFITGCATTRTPRGFIVGNQNVSIGEKYTTALVKKSPQPYNGVKVKILVRENFGKYHGIARPISAKSTIYEIAYYAKAKGYKAVKIKSLGRGNPIDDKMINTAQDLLNYVTNYKKRTKVSMYPVSIFYREKPSETFTIDTDDLLNVFAPYKYKNIIKRVEYIASKCNKGESILDCSYKNPVGTY